MNSIVQSHFLLGETFKGKFPTQQVTCNGTAEGKNKTYSFTFSLGTVW